MQIPVTYIEAKTVYGEISAKELMRYINQFIITTFNGEYAFLITKNNIPTWVRREISSHVYDEDIRPATPDEIKVMAALDIVQQYINTKL